MKIWTWGELKNKVLRDLDLEDEDFISPNELLGYANAAVNEAEQEFIAIYPKYFETMTDLELVKGEDTYTLPSDIYANKITLIQYDDGSNKYPIRRIKDLKEIAYVNENDCYRYRIFNASGVGSRIVLYPASRESSVGNVTIYHLRNALEIIDDNSILDMPEASNFILQHIKDSCRNKELGTLYSAPQSAELKRQKSLMVSALLDMVPDEDNTIEPDTSFYNDFDLGGF